MSKWHDIRVIDDERVADFIREVPEARAGTLTLQSGIAVARRAGAGKLVMGDLLKLGSRTQDPGKVFGMLIVIAAISALTDYGLQMFRRHYLDW